MNQLFENKENLCPWPKVCSTPYQIEEFKRQSGKKILTIFGYVIPRYENELGIINKLQQILKEKYPPEEYILNIPPLGSGIGIIFKMVKRESYQTTGIISSKVYLERDPMYSGYPIECDKVFIVQTISIS